MDEAEHDRAAKHDEFEPADRPVRAYETLLCMAVNAALFSVYWWHPRPAEIITAVLACILIVVALVKLLLPKPRFSATRGAYVFLGLLALVLLSNLNWVRR